MSVFGAYSKYYNLLYKDKDYVGEARYVDSIIQQHAPGAKTILDLGCGTGSHDFELAKLGYEITGVDMSQEMLAAANLHLSSLNPQPSTEVPSSASCSFHQGDIRTILLSRTFDVVVSLFHVMSYQVTNEDLQAAFATARAHLKPGGLFMFDCWYGPAVLSNPPVVRVKRLEDNEISVVRIAEPVMHYNENVVDVNYQVLITDKATGAVEQLRETHRMRYLFLPEIDELSKCHKMERKLCCEWMTMRMPDCDTWGICIGLSNRKI